MICPVIRPCTYFMFVGLLLKNLTLHELRFICCHLFTSLQNLEIVWSNGYSIVHIIRKTIFRKCQNATSLVQIFLVKISASTQIMFNLQKTPLKSTLAFLLTNSSFTRRYNLFLWKNIDLVHREIHRKKHWLSRRVSPQVINTN